MEIVKEVRTQVPEIDGGTPAVEKGHLEPTFLSINPESQNNMVQAQMLLREALATVALQNPLITGKWSRVLSTTKNCSLPCRDLPSGTGRKPCVF